MNVLAVREATKFVTEYVRAGKGPFVMEMNTYRYVGHSMSDPGTTYRTRDEIAAARAERDPIDKVKKWLLEHDLATEDELKEMELEIRKEMDEAVEFAKASKEPEIKEMFTDVYRQPVPVRGVERALSYTP